MAKARPTKKAKRAKAKLSRKRTKMKKASNSCCPLIHIDCRPAFKKEKATHTGDDTVVHYTKKVPAGKKCTIRFGKRTFKNLTGEGAGKKVDELKAALKDKRCASGPEMVISKTHRKPEVVGRPVVGGDRFSD